MFSASRIGSGFSNFVSKILNDADIRIPGSIDVTDAADTWMQDYWEAEVESAYGSLQNNPRLNPGQQGILESEQDNVLGYLYGVGEGYEQKEFIDFLSSELEDKYNALSDTWNEYAATCEDIWDHSSGGDGFGTKKFMGRSF
jgi:hypothetical protein